MASIIQNHLQNALSKGITQTDTKESIDWFRKNVRRTAVDPSRVMREERDNLVNSWTNTAIGKMYMVYYDPKHKKTLPYYDRFPLIIPIEKYKDGILGLNLHYLPPFLRAKLLDSLYEVISNDKYNEKTKFEISYGLLKGASKYREFKPCIKRYLGNHFRSRFVRIPSAEWTPAVFLPVEQFEKASRSAVWSDSRRIIKG